MRKLLLVGGLISFSFVLHAQIDILTQKILKKDPFQLKKPPITTSLSDAKWADAAKDGFVPGDP